MALEYTHCYNGHPFISPIRIHLVSVLLKVLFCSSVYCSVTLDDHSIESEGLLPAYNIVSNRDVVEGSGDEGVAPAENVRLTAEKCDCSNINTTPDSRVFYSKYEFIDKDCGYKSMRQQANYTKKTRRLTLNLCLDSTCMISSELD